MPVPTTKHIFVLDDDPGILALIASAAELWNLNAYTTSDPDDFFKNIPLLNPDVAIIDLVMPKQDGIEILQRLANHSDHRPRLIIASGAGGRVLDAAKRVATDLGLEVAGVLSKPFHISSIRELLVKEVRAKKTFAPSALAKFDHQKNTPVFGPEELLVAISEKQLVAHYQPKVCCKTGKLRGFEALVRWQHPEYGLVSPDSFIGALEDMGCAWQMTIEVLRQALAFLKSLKQDNLNISVNLSPRLLNKPDIVDLMVRACTEFEIATDRVVLELTESSATDNDTMVLNIFTRLRVKGFKLSIDDFGVGFSSLVQLSQLPFSEIKIDKSFINNIGLSDEAAKIIKNIVALGEELGLVIVAEGIETLDQLKQLSAFGCDVVQGYYVSRPLPAEIMHNWIENYQPLACD